MIEGDLYIPTDSFYDYFRYSGSAWVPLRNGKQLTLPVDGDFSWINQGSASVSAGGGGIYMSVAGSGASNDMRIRKKAAPSTPYTITAAFLPNIPGINFAGMSLLFRQSSDGKLHILEMAYSSGWQLGSQKWTSPTAFSASYGSTVIGTVPMPIFLRIADDGTNRICSYSTDGRNFAQLHSVGRTDFLTADEVGFCVNAQTTAGKPVATTLISWKQE